MTTFGEAACICPSSPCPSCTTGSKARARRLARTQRRRLFGFGALGVAGALLLVNTMISMVQKARLAHDASFAPAPMSLGVQKGS